jgi:hypothetical protein
MIEINSGFYKRHLENRKIDCKTSNDAVLSYQNKFGTDTPPPYVRVPVHKALYNLTLVYVRT